MIALNRVIFFCIFLVGSLQTLAQQDTLYILYENHPENSNSLTTTNKDSLEYPQDGIRVYEINGYLFVRYGNMPDWAKFKDDYFLANQAFVNNRVKYDQRWFMETPYAKVQEVFSAYKPVIYLAEKKRKVDGYYIFVRVYPQFPIEL